MIDHDAMACTQAPIEDADYSAIRLTYAMQHAKYSHLLAESGADCDLTQTVLRVTFENACNLLGTPMAGAARRACTDAIKQARDVLKTHEQQKREREAAASAHAGDLGRMLMDVDCAGSDSLKSVYQNAAVRLVWSDLRYSYTDVKIALLEAAQTDGSLFQEDNVDATVWEDFIEFLRSADLLTKAQARYMIGAHKLASM